MKHFSVFCVADGWVGARKVFYTKIADVALRNLLKHAAEGKDQMRSTTLDQMGNERTRKKNTAQTMSTAYAIYVYDCVRLDIQT